MGVSYNFDYSPASVKNFVIDASVGFKKSFDSNPSAALSFLQIQSAYVESEIYRIQYPQYNYTSLIPLDSSAPEWSKSVIFQAIDARGRLKLLGPNSNDVPTVDIAKSQGIHEIQTAALGYTYTLEELEYARLSNTTVDTERGMAVRDVTEQGLNQIYLLGQDDVGEGLFTSELVSREAAAATIPQLVNNIQADGPQALINLFGAARDRVKITNTRLVHVPTHFVLPPAQYSLLSRTIMGQNNGSNYTVLQFLKSNFPEMEFAEDLNLEGIGASNSDRLMVYKRDMRVVKGHDVMPLKFLAPATADNIHYRVNALVRTGGTEWRTPSAAHYVDGI